MQNFFCPSVFLLIQSFLLLREKIERRNDGASEASIFSQKRNRRSPFRRVMCTPFSRHFRNTLPAPLIESKDDFCTQQAPFCSWSTVFFRNCSIACIRRLLNGAPQMNNGLVQWNPWFCLNLTICLLENIVLIFFC